MAKALEDRPAWQPFPGPQTQALESKADVLFYGGAAGGGKTDLLLGLAHTSHRRSIIFRREYPQLRAVIDRSWELYGGRGTFNRTDMVWNLRAGQQIEFGAVALAGDEMKYQGRPHDLKAFDEVTHFTEMQFRFLCGWLRSGDPAQRCRVICAGNPPTDSDGEWVTRFWGPWLDPAHESPAKPGELRWFTTLDGREQQVDSGAPFNWKGELVTPKSRTFIPARVSDNPILMASGYVAQLQALPEPLRSKMLGGDFAAGREDSPWAVIPTAWIRAAQERWKARPKPELPMIALGVDVARGGRDKTVITPRHGNWIGHAWTYPGTSTPDGPAVAALVLKHREGSARINVDVIGVGGAVLDALRASVHEAAVPMNASEASQKTDKSGQLHFVNQRGEWWWGMRDALDPANGQDLALPPDPELLADLAAPRWKLTVRGIQIESKEDVIKRIGRSPDKGDSAVYSLVVKTFPGAGLFEYYRREAEKIGARAPAAATDAVPEAAKAAGTLRMHAPEDGSSSYEVNGLRLELDVGRVAAVPAECVAGAKSIGFRSAP